jgi:hypothetical protein
VPFHDELKPARYLKDQTVDSKIFAALGRLLSAAGSGCARMQKRTNAIGQGWHFWAAEIDLAIQTHKQLHGLYLRIVCGKRSAGANKLVRQVLDGVSETLEGVASLWRDSAATHCAADRYCCRCRHTYRETAR